MLKGIVTTAMKCEGETILVQVLEELYQGHLRGLSQTEVCFFETCSLRVTSIWRCKWMGYNSGWHGDSFVDENDFVKEGQWHFLGDISQFCLLIKHSDQFLESAVKGTPFNTVTMVYNFLSLCDGQPVKYLSPSFFAQSYCLLNKYLQQNFTEKVLIIVIVLIS